MDVFAHPLTVCGGLQSAVSLCKIIPLAVHKGNRIDGCVVMQMLNYANLY